MSVLHAAARDAQTVFLHCYTNLLENSREWPREVISHYVECLRYAFDYSQVLILKVTDRFDGQIKNEAADEFDGRTPLEYCCAGLESLAHFMGRTATDEDRYNVGEQKNVRNEIVIRIDRLNWFAKAIHEDPEQQSPSSLMQQTFSCAVGVWHMRFGYCFPMCLWVKEQDKQGRARFIYNLNDDPEFGAPYRRQILTGAHAHLEFDEGSVKVWPVLDSNIA